MPVSTRPHLTAEINTWEKLHFGPKKCNNATADKLLNKKINHIYSSMQECYMLYAGVNVRSFDCIVIIIS
jgi:hypothetical protein